MANKDTSFVEFLNELTLQIFADRYNLKLKLKEINKETNKERIYTINCNKNENEDKKKTLFALEN